MPLTPSYGPPSLAVREHQQTRPRSNTDQPTTTTTTKMALISAKTIITSLSLFHVTLGFFFLTNPMTIADQALVYVLGEAMGMPYDRSFEAHSPALAFLAVVLATMGLTDLVSLSLPEEVALFEHWGTQAPVRLLLSFILITYSFLFSPSSPIFGDSSTARARMTHPPPGYAASTWGGDGLKNRVFFAFAFVEVVSWFWVWVTLREERQAGLAARRGGPGPKRRASSARV
ncbi:hypothetical protein KVR01_013373 [Diaporthe batatas]|uniref:uncharacterized protein n=1 Tax=Diaporthe batatas TaxID=748121 RepID=UPI001D035FE3|nr:uncharacterized protein KVR01_013373 [Diaporthe batatas]KAG8156768.1 hypothetical protein KVR01_013373 [Diaporthe batatas]